MFQNTKVLFIHAWLAMVIFGITPLGSYVFISFHRLTNFNRADKSLVFLFVFFFLFGTLVSIRPCLVCSLPNSVMVSMSVLSCYKTCELFKSPYQNLCITHTKLFSKLNCLNTNPLLHKKD